MSASVRRPNRISVRFGAAEVAQLVRVPGRDGGGRVLWRELPAMDAAGVAPVMAGAVAPLAGFPESMCERGDVWRKLTGFPGWLADSLPDSWGAKMLEKYIFESLSGEADASTTAAELASDLLTMLAFVGNDSPVGLSFVPDFSDHKAAPAALDLVEAVREARAVETRRGVAVGRFDQLRGGWSAGGARPKTHLGVGRDGAWVVGCGVGDLLGMGFEPWLLKLGHDSDFSKTGNQSGRMEYAYHLMARDCGILMTECRLMEDAEGVGHFLTKRFDRTLTGVYPFRSLAGLLASDKSVSVSYERQWRVRRELERSDAGAGDFLLRAAFNVAAAVRDDHSRNFGYLLVDGAWRQSPAFDLAFCDARLHCSTVAGRDSAITGRRLVDFGVSLGLSVSVAESVVGRVADTVSRWPEFAAKAGVNPEMTGYVSGMLVDVRLPGRVAARDEPDFEPVDGPEKNAKKPKRRDRGI